MNLSSLDYNLRAYTASEKMYKNGKHYFTFEDLPIVIRNGRQVRLMDFSHKIGSPINHLFIKKQSRFQACPMHIHNWVEINYMYDGTCPQIINDSSYELKKGQVVFIDTDTPHSTKALGERDIMVSLVISKDYLNSNFFSRLSKDSILSKFFINTINKSARHDNYILFHSEKSRRLPLFFNELLCEFYDPALNSPDIISSLFTLIISELINVYENDLGQKDLNENKTTIIPILRYIEGNYKKCSLESTARFFNMNSNYLTTLLKQQTGQSYKELVQTQRLNMAAKMLRNSEMPVTSIANFVGYENISFFYKIFKTKYNCSPKEFRDS